MRITVSHQREARSFKKDRPKPTGPSIFRGSFKIKRGLLLAATSGARNESGPEKFPFAHRNFQEKSFSLSNRNQGHAASDFQDPEGSIDHLNRITKNHAAALLLN